jgi:hypothetical protein
VLPAAVFGVWLLVEGDLRRPLRVLRRYGVAWGLLLVLGLVVPVFLWADRATEGEFFRVFFWHHNVERGFGGSRLRAHPWWFYGPQFLLDFAPWSLLLPVAIVPVVRRGYRALDAEARFGLVWFLTLFALLSCLRYKRADYLVPAYPGAALFLASVLEGWYQALVSRQRAWARWGFGLVLAGFAAAWFVRVHWLLPRWEPHYEHRSFACVVRQYVPAPEEVVFFRTEAHALAFHVGRPLRLLLEWQELAAWLVQPGTHHVVVPEPLLAECLARWPQLQATVVARNSEAAGGPHDKPMVLLRFTLTERTACPSCRNCLPSPTAPSASSSCATTTRRTSTRSCAAGSPISPASDATRNFWWWTTAAATAPVRSSMHSPRSIPRCVYCVIPSDAALESRCARGSSRRRIRSWPTRRVIRRIRPKS